MAVMNRNTFAKDLQDGLNAHFGMEYSQHPDEWRGCFEVENSQKAYEEDVLEVGFGAAQVKTEGDSVSYDAGGQGWTARYTNKTIALAFAITEEAVEDNRYQRLGPKYVRALARSMKHTKEIYGAAVFNNATSASHLGGDGVALLSTAHPLWVGGTFSNMLATPADLSESSLEDILIQIRKAKDDRNVEIALRAKKLVIPPDLMFVAERILKTRDRPGTADNDTNAIRSLNMIGSMPEVVTRISDTDAWFVGTDCPDGLKYIDRLALQRKMEGEFETGNLRYKVRERYVFGWTDPRGVYGSMGG